MGYNTTRMTTTTTTTTHFTIFYHILRCLLSIFIRMLIRSSHQSNSSKARGIDPRRFDSNFPPAHPGPLGPGVIPPYGKAPIVVPLRPCPPSSSSSPSIFPLFPITSSPPTFTTFLLPALPSPSSLAFVVAVRSLFPPSFSPKSSILIPEGLYSLVQFCLVRKNPHDHRSR